jgi:hypothetical protein
MVNFKTMAKKNEAAVALGRLGGRATGFKGLAAMPEGQRKEIAAKGLATRRANAKKKAGATKKKAAKG